MPTTKGRLRPRDERKFRRNYVFLREEVDAKEIAPALYEKKVITKDDLNNIMNEISGKLNRNDYLINLMLDSGPGNSYQLYLEVLNEKYGHVVDQLERPEYAWVSELGEDIKKHVLTQNDAKRIASFFSDSWEIIMGSFGFNETEISTCKEENAGSEQEAKVLLLQRLVSPGDHTVDMFMTHLIQIEENSDPCPTINWEGLENCVKSIDVHEMDIL